MAVFHLSNVITHDVGHIFLNEMQPGSHMTVHKISAAPHGSKVTYFCEVAEPILLFHECKQTINGRPYLVA